LDLRENSNSMLSRMRAGIESKGRKIAEAEAEVESEKAPP
jgi:hypothetical protein